MSTIPIGGSGGFVPDMVSNNNTPHLRRLKTESLSSLVTGVLSGLTYPLSGEYPSVSSVASIAVNFAFASEVEIYKVITNPLLVFTALIIIL